MIIYKGILERLKESGITQYVIFKQGLMSMGTITSIKHNRPVSTRTIDTICRLCHCQPGDILEYVEDDEQSEASDK